MRETSSTATKAPPPTPTFSHRAMASHGEELLGGNDAPLVHSFGSFHTYRVSWRGQTEKFHVFLVKAEIWLHESKDGAEKRRSCCRSRDVQAGSEWRLFIYFLNFCLADAGTSEIVKTTSKANFSKLVNNVCSWAKVIFRGSEAGNKTVV